MEITVYADVLLAVNFLIDYLLLLFCARLSGRRMIRKRLLAGALVGALTSLVIFLPPLSFWPMTLLKAGIAALMVRLAYPWLSWRVFFRDSFLFFTVSFLLAGGLLLHRRGAGSAAAARAGGGTGGIRAAGRGGRIRPAHPDRAHSPAGGLHSPEV